MWLAERSKPIQPSVGAELGVTTISGGDVSVMTRGELRKVPVFGPGGCVWMPEKGDTVLVLKGGPGGEEQCVAGREQKTVPAGMQPGEVILCAGDAAVWLRKDGSILLKGRVSIEGTVTVNGIPWVPTATGE